MTRFESQHKQVDKWGDKNANKPLKGHKIHQASPGADSAGDKWEGDSKGIRGKPSRSYEQLFAYSS